MVARTLRGSLQAGKNFFGCFLNEAANYLEIMKKLTLARLKKLFKQSLIDAGCPEDVVRLEASVKVGREAQRHTGSKNTKGYFATEGSDIGNRYWANDPRPYWAWYEKLSATLKAEYGLYLESINSCEIGLYQV